MEMRDCPKWISCSAPVCPLDDDHLMTVHLKGERICFYLRESVKDGVEAIFRGSPAEALYLYIRERLPAIIETYGPIRRGLKSSRKTGSKMDIFKRRASDGRITCS